MTVSLQITDLAPPVNGYVAPTQELVFLVTQNVGDLADLLLTVELPSGVETIYEASAFTSGYSGTVDVDGATRLFTFTRDALWPTSGEMSVRAYVLESSELTAPIEISVTLYS